MSIAATNNIFVDLGADWVKVLTLNDAAGDPIALTPAVAGVKQVESNAFIGTVSGSGVVAVVFLSELTGTISKLVPVVDGDSATVVAAKTIAAFNDDPKFSDHFDAANTGQAIRATAHVAADNDATMNWDIAGAGTTVAGLTPDPTSTNTTAGVAQVFGPVSFTGHVVSRFGTKPLAGFRFEIIDDGSAGQVRVILSKKQNRVLSITGQYLYDWTIRRSGYRTRTVQGRLTPRGFATSEHATL